VTYTDLLTKMLNENFLFSALLELTYRCNLNCCFCYNDRMRTGTPLSIDEYVKLFHDLRDLGTLELTFSGGEPLLHPCFFELGREARQLGFALRVKTNGIGLQEAVAQRLLNEVDPFVIEISLHGAHPATYERQTRVSGSFGRLMDNLQTLRRLGMRMQLNATLTAWNETELEEMIKLAEDMGMRIQIDSRVTPRDDGSLEPLCISPSLEAIERLLRIHQESADVALPHLDQDASRREGYAVLASTRRKFCGAGSLGVVVDPWGNVYPCVQWRTSAGNLHEDSIKSIWYGSPVLQDVRETLVKVMEERQAQEVDPLAPAFCPGLTRQLESRPQQLEPAG
jgi:MoaA/NifB/PqqE/SkfB family radical SAM enzyme